MDLTTIDLNSLAHKAPELALMWWLFRNLIQSMNTRFDKVEKAIEASKCQCVPKPTPMKRTALLLILLALPATADAATKGGPIGPDGKTQITCYLPLSERMFNTGGSDGKGLCVYSSVVMAARYQQETSLFGLRAYAEQRPGGSWPEKLARDISAVAPNFKDWLNYQGKDFDVLRAAINSGRMLSVAIPGHMLNVVHIDDNYVVWMDNNAVYDKRTKADNQYQWMTPQEFKQKWSGWAVVLLKPSPPPAVILQDLVVQTPALAVEDAPAWKPAKLVWKTHGSKTQVFLSIDGKDVGGWDYAKKFWRDYEGGKWTATKEAAPYALPDWGEVQKGDIVAYDYGCNYVWDGVESFAVNGVPCTKAEAFDVIGQCPGPNCPNPQPKPKVPGPKQPKQPQPKQPGPGPVIPDDSGKLRVIVIGDSSSKVKHDWDTAAELAPWRDRAIFNEYPEGHPYLAAAGLPDKGFHLVIQLPRDKAGFPGKFATNYTTYPGPAALAAALAQFDPAGPKVDPAPKVEPKTPPDEQPKTDPKTDPTAKATDGVAGIGSLATILAVLAAAIGRYLTKPTEDQTSWEVQSWPYSVLRE